MSIQNNHYGQYQHVTEQTNDQCAHVQFHTRFSGKSVCWHARIFTVSYYLDSLQKEDNPDLKSGVKQFIEIKPEKSDGVFDLSVCLATEKIDHPTILKTIIMIRNYKRLQIGLHEFGPDQILSESREPT